MNRVLLTGATGFVGKHLLSDLKSHGFDVQILNLRTVHSKFDFRNTDTLIHLAGKAHDLKNTSSSSEYYETNYELTKNVYNAFIASEVRKFIFMSSVKASADEVPEILKESDKAKPMTHYGKSKRMAEEFILSQQLPEGKSFFILRPCMIHGPGNKGNLNLLYKLISKGIPYPLAAFENKRSFLSIENLCFVIRELLNRDDIASGIYNVADNEVLSTNDLIKLIAKASDRSPRLWKINPLLIRTIAKFGDTLKLPLTSERLNKLTENYIVDNSKIKNALGKEFPVQAREGIIKTIKSFQKAI
jgi:nucleoside-diphosphate-sugar epimerase